MALNLEVVADAIAQSGMKSSKQFAKAEAGSAMGFILAHSDPDDIKDNMLRIGNISAVRQELEKGGLLPTATSNTPLIVAVKAALAS